MDKGEERGNQCGPADDRDVGFGKEFPVFQSLVDAVQENAAQDEQQCDADETGCEDEDLPAFDVRIPGHGHNKVVQP